MTPDLSTSTMRPVERRPRSWLAAVFRSFRGALRPAAREDLAWSAAGILAVIVLFWVGQGIAVLRESTQADLVMAVWFSSREEMTLWAFTIWVMAAPCVLLPRFALGDVADRGEDPVLRHGLASGHILALQLPAALFAATALALGVPPAMVIRPLFTAATLTLSAAAVAVAVNECRLWDFARRFLLRALGLLLFLVACFGRRYFGAEPLPALTSLAEMPIIGAGAGRIGGGFPFDVALTAFILLTCARVITSLRSPAAPPDSVGDGLQALAPAGVVPSTAAAEEESVFVVDEGEEIRERIARAQLDLYPGAGLRTALALAYDRGTLRLLLTTLPVFALMALCASGAMWLQRMPGGSILTSLAGYPPIARNPLLGDWNWQWSQSGSFALLAAIAAWTVLAARLVVAPLAASMAARLRGGTDQEAGILSGLSPFEMLTWTTVPSALPVATVGLVGALLAALPAYRDGAPADVLVWVVLIGPAQTLLCGLAGVAVGLRARTAKAAGAIARGVAGLGLPAGFLLLSWGLSLATRNPDPTDRFLRSIGSAYQGAVVLSILLSAEIAWWMLRRLRPTRAPEGGRAARVAWRIAAGSLLALGGISGPTSTWARHLNPAEQAFAAGDYRLAARLLRQVEPRELPGPLRRASLSGESSPSGRSGQPAPRSLAPYERALPTAADSVRPVLAAAEYAAGRPDRARKVMNANSIPAGLAWPKSAESMTRAEVYRYLLRAGAYVRGNGAQLSTLNALIAREAAKAAPKSVEDRLAYARAIGNSSSDSPLPSAKSVFEEVLELDPTNKEALLALGHAAHASRLYPDDLDAWRAYRTAAKSPAEKEKALLSIIRLRPEQSFYECRELVRQTISAGDFPKALRYLELLRPYKTPYEVSYYWKERGWVLAETGHIQEALAAYAKARQDRMSWDRDSVLNYMALAYLQAGDISRAREAFSSSDDRRLYIVQDLFYTWCSDKLAPPEKGSPGAMERRLAKERWITQRMLPGLGAGGDDCRCQARRILGTYPDCLPAAVLLAGAIYDHGGQAADADVAKRVRSVLGPFADRFPQIAEMQERLDPTPRVVRTPVARGITAPTTPARGAQTPAGKAR